ncbi:unnamed protein product, partial [Brassica oleracea]
KKDQNLHSSNLFTAIPIVDQNQILYTHRIFLRFFNSVEVHQLYQLYLGNSFFLRCFSPE